ncbi:aminodeoxychorismate/anthranilate synthase component II [uncultured Clostridium sp.]|uniref:anthranilate synthase component II n=1 Tax=uncultured Clostridium sp. TaxID=59620 RepID=UPI0025E45872|nr:aminodeoxychorismate/anthranilate synthase component II [uncultured Clostridium sp.]
MILLIDNYDSFTFNLYQYLGEIAQVKVVRNDEITIDEIRKINPKGIVISPGPKTPKEAGISVEVVKKLGEEFPILGICLGHQSIGEAFGGKVVRAKEIFHGKTSQVLVKESDIFKGLEKEIKVMRYHSLIVEKESLPEELEIIAETKEDKVIMALKHKDKDIYGIQFHPESIFTPDGKKIIENFIEVICNENR